MIRIPRLPHQQQQMDEHESLMLISMEISIDEELRQLEAHMLVCPELQPKMQAEYDRLLEVLKATGLEFIAPERPGQHHWEERAKLMEIKATIEERRREIAEELGVLDN